MPTQHERLFHGIGAGDDLAVTPTSAGRIGGLICWENRMPLARYAVYRGGPQIWVAPTADDSDGWLATMRHVAIESGAFVVSVPQFIPGSAFGEDFPVPVERDRVYGRGGAVIVEPTWGEVIAGPLYDEEGILVADCDLRAGLHAKRWFDAVGHYSREDVLLPARRLAAAQHARVAAAEREPLRVEALQQRLGVLARGAELVAEAAERDLALGLEQRDEARADRVERLRVDVHRRAEPDGAAGGAQRGELLGGVEVGVERRLRARGAQLLLDRERGGRERRGGAVAAGRAGAGRSASGSGSGSPRSSRASRASRSREGPCRRGAGSSTTPPPSVSGGASARITSRSPAIATSGRSSRSCA